MSCQKLKRSRNFKPSEEILNKIRDSLPTLPSHRVSLKLIAQKLNISEEEALKACLYLVRENQASVRYEITCPECASDVLIIDDLSDLPNEEITCDIYGETFSPS